MADQADIVVVGGGILGCAAALQLAEAGAGRVRVLERDGLFQATSGAGGGFVAPWAAGYPGMGPEEVEVEHYGIDFYTRLQESGHDIGCDRNGVLFVEMHGAPSWAAVRESGREVPGSELVSSAQIEELTGGAVLAAGVERGELWANACQVNPPLVGAALAAQLEALGGKVETRRPVTELLIEGEKVRGVSTPSGSVEADVVVLAAGAWSNQVLAPHGLRLPIAPQITSRVITEPVGAPARMPALFLAGISSDPASPLIWMRTIDGALMWGGTYAGNPRDLLVDAPMPERFDEVPLDGVFESQRVVEQALEWIPPLGQAKSTTVRHGAYCVTPDSRSLVGPMPGVEGLFVLGGDNETGVTHGPGFGKALAERITAGASSLVSIDCWRLDRFDREFASDLEVLEALRALQASWEL